MRNLKSCGSSTIATGTWRNLAMASGLPRSSRRVASLTGRAPTGRRRARAAPARVADGAAPGRHGGGGDGEGGPDADADGDAGPRGHAHPDPTDTRRDRDGGPVLPCARRGARDSLQQTCSALQTTCAEYRVAAERRDTAQRVEIAALERALKAQRPGKVRLAWEKVDGPLLFVTGALIGSRLR